MSSDQTKTSRRIPHPKRLQEDLEEREKEFFKKNIPHNSSVNIKYKKKLFGTSFFFASERSFSQKPRSYKTKNSLNLSASKEVKSVNLEINGDVELDQRQPKLNLHMHYRPENRKDSYSVSVSGESDQLKNFKASFTSQEIHNNKLKLQVSNPLGKGGPKPWEFRFTSTDVFPIDPIGGYKGSFVHEYSYSHGTSIDGMNLLKFESGPQENFGVLFSDRVGYSPFTLSFKNFTFFYNLPKTLLSLQINNLLKPTNNFSAFFLQKFTKRMEVGALLESGSKGTKLHFGLTHQIGSGNFKFKINDKLHCGWSYKWHYQKNTVFCVGGHFPLTKTYDSENFQNNLFPFGIKIEFKD